MFLRGFDWTYEINYAQTRSILRLNRSRVGKTKPMWTSCSKCWKCGFRNVFIFPFVHELQLSCCSAQAQIISLLMQCISFSGWSTKAHRRPIWERLGHCQDVGSDLWAKNKGIQSCLDQQISVNTNLRLHNFIGRMSPLPCSLCLVVIHNFLFSLCVCFCFNKVKSSWTGTNMLMLL